MTIATSGLRIIRLGGAKVNGSLVFYVDIEPNSSVLLHQRTDKKKREL